MTPHCSSCGREIPEGQGKSCSYCYGDPFYGRDGYLLAQMEQDAQENDAREREARAEQEAIEQQQREER